MTIIAFIGLKQSGKSTAAKYLQEKYGFVRHNFKDALVNEIKQNFPDLLQEIKDIYDLPHMDTIDALFEEKPPLVRKLLQNYGTEVRRKDDINYWVDKWLAEFLFSKSENFVVDDVRFRNEAQTVKNQEGIIIKIIRTGQVSNDNHSSETEHNQIIPDYTIEVGDGEQDKLYAELDKIIYDKKNNE